MGAVFFVRNIEVSAPRRHHYVPVHVLKNFADQATNQIWCFDKLHKKRFRTSPKNVCAERDFHTFEFEGLDVSYEAWISAIEDDYQEILRRVLESDTLVGLEYDDFVALAMMVAFQFLRTRNSRNNYLHLARGIHEHAAKFAEASGAQFNETLPSENDLKITMLQQLKDMVPKLVEHMTKHHFLLLRAPHDHEFWISDSPVALHNDNDYKAYGNLGFGVPGIQIYQPISSALTLAFWCPAVLGKLNRDVQCSAKEAFKTYLSAETEFHRGIAKAVIDEVREHRSKIEGMTQMVIEKRETECNVENVAFLNSLQLLNAERQVFSQSGRFAELDDMLADNPKYALPGTRFTV